MTGRTSLAVSYAAQRSATGYTAHAWEYSTNGTNWIPVQVVNPIPAAFGTITLTTITGLDNAADAYLRFSASGATAVAGNNRLDNIQLSASVATDSDGDGIPDTVDGCQATSVVTGSPLFLSAACGAVPGAFLSFTSTNGLQVAVAVETCPAGSSCAGGTAPAVACAAGSFSSATGASSCASCAAACASGSAETQACTSTTDRVCAEDSDGDGIPDTVDGCQATSVVTGSPLFLSAACGAVPGAFLSFTSTNGLQAAVAVETCPVGSSCAGGTAPAVACAAGSFSSATGASTCASCAASCGAGTAETQACTSTTDRVCDLDADNDGIPDVIDACQATSAVTGSPLFSAATCGAIPGAFLSFATTYGLQVAVAAETCPAGSSCAGGTAPAVACAAGSFSSATGAAECLTCNGTTNTPTGATECTTTTDSDGDGIPDGDDACAGTPVGEAVSSSGCSCSQVTLSDGDDCTQDVCNAGSVSHPPVVGAVALSSSGSTAPVTVAQGSNGVVLLDFTLTPTCMSSFTFSGLELSFTGTMLAGELSNLRLVEDLDDDGVVSAGDVAHALSPPFSPSVTEYSLSTPVTLTHQGRLLGTCDVAVTLTNGRTCTCHSGYLLDASNTPISLVTGSAQGSEITFSSTDSDGDGLADVGDDCHAVAAVTQSPLFDASSCGAQPGSFVTRTDVGLVSAITAVTTCPAGSSCAGGQAPAVPCPSGQFSSVTGAVVCQTCGGGTDATTGATKCLDYPGSPYCAGSGTASPSPGGGLTGSMFTCSGAACSSLSLDPVTGDIDIPLSLTLPAVVDVCYGLTVCTQVTIAPSVTPTVHITGASSSMCAASTMQLTAEITGGGSAPVITWRVGTSVVQTGGLVYVFGGQAPGDYQVRCTVASSDACASLPEVDDEVLVSATAPPSWYPDVDGDGFGDMSATPVSSCTNPGGRVLDQTDCNDNCASCTPTGTEVCDASNRDEDCDGLVDELDYTFFVDADGDGYGSLSGGAVVVVSGTCTAPPQTPVGRSLSNDDCDDLHSSVFPGAPERCDGLDNDCSSSSAVDNGCDDDNDGYCDFSLAFATGATCLEGDCDDGDASISPGDPEVCDGSNADEDCDGLVDELDYTFYVDLDGDGYGALSSGSVLVLQGTCTAPPSTPVGRSLSSADCDDLHSSVYPGAPEVCDGMDNDCNSASLTDGGCDDDVDGYRDSSMGFATGATCAEGDCMTNASAAIPMVRRHAMVRTTTATHKWTMCPSAMWTGIPTATAPPRPLATACVPALPATRWQPVTAMTPIRISTRGS